MINVFLNIFDSNKFEILDFENLKIFNAYFFEIIFGQRFFVDIYIYRIIQNQNRLFVMENVVHPLH